MAELFSLSVAVVLLLCFGSNRGQENCNSSNQTLEFLYMTSFGEAFNSSGSVLGMMMALERINSNSSVLPGYQLNYNSIVDTQCERSTSLSRFLKKVTNPCRNFVAVIGSGCSVATGPVAEIGSFWGLSHISYVSSDGVFKSTTRFRKYLQISPSEDNFAPAIVAGVQRFGWSQVGIITQKESLFTTSHALLTQQLEDANITVLPSAFLDTDADPADVPDLFPKNGHVFFLNTYEDKARQVICEAYYRGLYGEHYVWLFHGFYDREWWQEPDTVFTYSCTADQLYEVVDRSFAIQQFPINSNRDKKAVGDLSYNEFLDEYGQRVANSSYQESYTSHMAYDATWALAFALERVLERQESGELGNCSDLTVEDTLQNWSYMRNATASCLLYQALLETRFEGLTGQVIFDENGIRVPIHIRLLQYRQGQLVNFALVVGSTIIPVNNFTIAALFPNGIPPDGTPMEIINALHPALVTIVYFLALLGLVFAGFCFLFIFLNRKKEALKLSTNVLNYCLIVGIVIILISLFFRTAYTTDETAVTVFCYLSAWLGNVGYVVTFGAILTKMFRTYYVFYYPSKQKIRLNNWHLLGMVTALTLVMVVVLLVGSIIPSTRPSAFLSEDLEFPPTNDERDVLQMFVYYHCYPRDSFVWFAVIYIILVLMHIAALVLAFQIKSIKVKVINDSKAVTGIVGITSIVIVVLIIVSFAFTGYQNIGEALFSGSLLIAAYSILVLAFVPKMMNVRKDPHGRHLQKDRSTIKLDKRGVMTVSNDDERIDQLYDQVEELEVALEAKRASLKATDSIVYRGSSNGNNRPNLSNYNNGKCLESTDGASSVFLDAPDLNNSGIDKTDETLV